MMNDFTVVPVIENSLFIDRYFFLHTSSSFIQDLTNRIMSLDHFVRDIEELKQIWIKPLKNSHYYELLLPESIVLCSLGKNTIELNGIYEKNIRNHAQFIKEGISISFSKKIIIINQNQITNKKIDKHCLQEEHLMENTIEQIVKTISVFQDRQQNIEVEVNHKMYEAEFESWLSTYDKSALDLLESNILSHPQMKYKKVSVDPIFGPFTMLFYIDSGLTFPLNFGQTFYTKLKNEQWVKATLHERYIDGNMNVIVLQFDRLYTINEFLQQGDLFIQLHEEVKEDISYHIYYNQLHSYNILKSLFSNQLNVNENNINIDVPSSIQDKFLLDEQQQKIAKQAIAAKQLFYIDGAVSTGKSTVLEYIKAYYESVNNRVLYIRANEYSVYDDGLFQSNTSKQKINELKELTLKAIDRYEEHIVADKKVITAYASDALDLEIAEEEHSRLTTYFKAFYDQIKLQYIEPLKQLYETYIKNENELNSLYANIKSTKQKLKKQMEKNEFNRWIILPVLLNLETKLKKSYLKFNELSEAQKIIINQYNDYTSEMRTVLDHHELNDKKDLWKAQRHHVNTLRLNLSKPFELASIQKDSIIQLDKDAIITKEKILVLANQLERLHQAYKEYRQKLSNSHDQMFFSLFIKEKKSIQLSMRRLLQHFSLVIDEFDVVLIDDAHTYTVLELFLALSLGKKVIVAGDKNQFSLNTVDKLYSDDILESIPLIYRKSAAQVLAKLMPETLQGQLIYLYRLMPPLTSIYNNAIFSDEVKIRNKTELEHTVTLNHISNPVLLLTTSQIKNRFESDIVGHGVYNHCEATAIVNVIVSMLETNIAPEDILITSFFDMQVDYIRTHLRYALPALSRETIHSMVLPLASCIGIERKIVLISLCTSNKKTTSTRDLIDLRYSYLWNIALSRAKEQLVIIGDIDYIKSAVSNERRLLQKSEYQYDWSSIDVANMMKAFIKLAVEGEVQFVSLDNFVKHAAATSLNGGFGYE